ncbi:hypothetical protein [Cognatiyoonia sp. IB215182]|uniref:hypothetical protein n=1 Tax=Cognatiyoonia sp. IB215182 TaxID=3097353 RepID=UPI002A109537|nr:hypothetical protein [Cognatiyoonia sp. IB215182]MDX8355838.1 hypothetical protein [Cognatiyoonia sp. IB215182]
MSRSTDIDVSVTIAPELRSILAARHNVTEGSGYFLQSVSQRPGSDERSKKSNLPEWKQIRLRRDGARPITFLGVEVLIFRGPISISGLKCEQEITLYLNQDGHFFVALRLSTLSNSSFRPWCRACAVDGLTIGPKLNRWVRYLSTKLMHPMLGDSKRQNPKVILDAVELLSEKTLRLTQFQ